MVIPSNKQCISKTRYSLSSSVKITALWRLQCTMQMRNKWVIKQLMSLMKALSRQPKIACVHLILVLTNRLTFKMQWSRWSVDVACQFIVLSFGMTLVRYTIAFYSPWSGSLSQKCGCRCSNKTWTDENGVIELIFVLKNIHIYSVAGIEMTYSDV